MTTHYADHVFWKWYTAFRGECNQPSTIDTTDEALRAYAESLGCSAWMPDEGCVRGHRVHGEWRRLPCDCAMKVQGRK